MRFIDVPGIGQCSCLALGTMAYTPERMEQAAGLLEAFVEMGGNVLDTAHNYGGEWEGRSERALGRWLQGAGNRERVILLDKGAHPDRRGPRVTPAAIAADLQDSLERLQVQVIDLYLLHRDDPGLPVGPIMEALNLHLRAGRIRAIGASNWTERRIEEANAYAREHDLTGFVCSSTNLSLARAKEARWPGCISLDRQGRDWHERTGFPLFSWSAQAGGFFTGRFGPERTDDADMVRVYYCEDNWERLRRAAALARAKGATATEVALAYVLHQPFPTSAIIGPLTLEELRQSASALRLALSADEVGWLGLQGRDAPGSGLPPGVPGR